MKKKRSNFLLLLPFFAFLLLGLPKAKADLNHSLFLKSDGSLWAMGANTTGQLGDGTTTNRNSPVQVAASGVIQTARGINYSLFLKSDGSLHAMGANFQHQLATAIGAGSIANSPVQLLASGVTQVAAGAAYTLFLKSDGSLHAMGANWYGQLGDGTTTTRSSPVQVVSSSVTQIAAGGNRSLFLKSDGSLWAMGGNGYGQLGDGTTTNRTSPVKIVDSDVTQIAAGFEHTLFLKSDGSLHAMGNNNSGQLGDGTTTDRTSPVQVVASGVALIAVGRSRNHSLFLKSDGSLHAMGGNDYGQLGDGTTIQRTSPVQIVSSGVTQVATGGYCSLFLKSDGSLWGMGSNGSGQLGDGTTTDRHTPVKIVDSGVVRLPDVPGNLSFGPGGNSSSGGGNSSSGGDGSSSGGGLYPVPYAGKVAVNGENFSGTAKFTFSIVEANGTTHWMNGADADKIIEVPVTGGRYLVLLGGQGMNPLPTSPRTSASPPPPTPSPPRSPDGSCPAP
jgi:alpha-tubulin suppressor-like RCC1 family protein